MGAEVLVFVVDVALGEGHRGGAVQQVAHRAQPALGGAQEAGEGSAEGVHLVGLSILSGSHRELVPEILDRMRAAGLEDVPVVVGGIIPDLDAKVLRERGVARVYTPKDFELEAIMSDLADLLSSRTP